MDEVLKLVNRLQSACTLLGDTAGQKEGDLPGLWDMLPSIVVIGGQVNLAATPQSCKDSNNALIDLGCHRQHISTSVLRSQKSGWSGPPASHYQQILLLLTDSLGMHVQSCASPSQRHHQTLNGSVSASRVLARVQCLRLWWAKTSCHEALALSLGGP